MTVTPKSNLIQIQITTPDGEVQTLEVDKYILIVPSMHPTGVPGMAGAELHAYPAMPPKAMRAFVEYSLRSYEHARRGN